MNETGLVPAAFVCLLSAVVANRYANGYLCRHFLPLPNYTLERTPE